MVSSIWFNRLYPVESRAHSFGRFRDAYHHQAAFVIGDQVDRDIEFGKGAGFITI